MNYATYFVLIMLIGFNLIWLISYPKFYLAAWKFQNPLWKVNYGYALFMIICLLLTLR